VFADCYFDVDLTFIVDSSNSVGEANFQRSLKFVSKIIRNLEFASGKARVALITFNDRAKTIFSLQVVREQGPVSLNLDCDQDEPAIL
jgi:hypothetical protein